MESLLSLSFDYISSRDATKIRRGLRQIESLLAQICLSPSSSSSSSSTSTSSTSPSSSPCKRRPSQSPGTHPEGKQLAALREDPAFREFFRLQEGFEWNVATRLISCLERLLGMGSSGAHDLLILSVLDILQGTLLLHPPSRCLFLREIYMNLLLDLLDSSNPPAIQSRTLLVLVTALLGNCANIRTFEAVDGLLVVTSLFKARGTTRDVKLKVVEFLYFYLMPETPPSLLFSSSSSTSSSSPDATVLQRSPNKILGAGVRRDTSGGDGFSGGGKSGGKTTEEKTRLLGRYLNNVEDLVQDLRENAPFGEVW